MLVSKNGYRKDKNGKWVKKPYAELNNSRHYILIKCDDCGKLFKTQLSNRNIRIKKGKPDFCNSCSKSGERNSAFGKNRKAILDYARKFVKQNPMQGKHHSPESRRKMSESKAKLISSGKFDIVSNNRGYKKWYISSKTGENFHADSALEYLRMIQLDQDEEVIWWTKRHSIRVEYTYDGVDRFCIPDFMIKYKDRQVIEEVKGRVTDKELAKKEAIADWCSTHGYDFMFTTQADLNKNGEYRKFLKEWKEND